MWARDRLYALDHGGRQAKFDLVGVGGRALGTVRVPTAPVVDRSGRSVWASAHLAYLAHPPVEPGRPSAISTVNAGSFTVELEGRASRPHEFGFTTAAVGVNPGRSRGGEAVGITGASRAGLDHAVADGACRRAKARWCPCNAVSCPESAIRFTNDVAPETAVFVRPRSLIPDQLARRAATAPWLTQDTRAGDQTHWTQKPSVISRRSVC